LAHRRRRNRPGIPADTADSGEEFVQPCGLVRGEEERGVIGGCGVLKGRGLMSITREKLVGALLRRVSVSREREKRGNGGGDDADTRVPPVSEGREKQGYRFGFC
jgi:hypothetical protein